MNVWRATLCNGQQNKIGCIHMRIINTDLSILNLDAFIYDFRQKQSFPLQFASEIKLFPQAMANEMKRLAVINKTAE